MKLKLRLRFVKQLSSIYDYGFVKAGGFVLSPVLHNTLNSEGQFTPEAFLSVRLPFQMESIWINEAV